jgi:hypothetical protein
VLVSADVWTKMLEHLDNLELISLFMTGSSVVRQKLCSQGGWKVFKVGRRFDVPFVTKWPRWLLSLLQGLSILEISPYHPEVILPTLRPLLQDIMALPKSLTNLELNFAGCIRDEFIPHLPPGLTRLSLPRNRSITHDGLQMLNRNIINLNLGSNLIISDPSRLPPGLASYTGSCNAILPKSVVIDSFPSELIELKLLQVNKMKSAWLPEHLHFFAHHSCLLSISIAYIVHIETEAVIVPMALSLPPQLTSLELIGNPVIPPTCLSSLPRSLLKLRLLFLNGFKVNLEWPNDMIATLPRNLTHLEVMPQWNEFGSRKAACSSLLTPECLMNIPSEIRTLRLYELRPNEAVSMNAISNQRHAYQLSNNQILQKHLDEYMSYLPTSITDLYIKISLENSRPPTFPSAKLLPPRLVSFPAGTLQMPQGNSASLSLSMVGHPNVKIGSMTGIPIPISPKQALGIPIQLPILPTHPIHGHPQIWPPQMGALPTPPIAAPSGLVISPPSLSPPSEAAASIIHNIPGIADNWIPPVPTHPSPPSSFPFPVPLPAAALLGPLLPPSLTSVSIECPEKCPFDDAEPTTVFNGNNAGNQSLLWLKRLSMLSNSIHSSSNSSNTMQLGTLLDPLRGQRVCQLLRLSHFNFTAEHLHFLPSSLTALEIHPMGKLYDNDILKLPASLTDLKIYDYDATLTDECLPAMPLDLVRLTLLYTNRIRGNIYPFPKKLQVIKLGKHIEMIRNYQPIFPHWTTELSLSTTYINDDTFAHGFPPFLTSLKIPSETLLSREIVPKFPQTLIHLDIPHLELYDQDVILLPRGMRTFEASKACHDLSEASCKDWPPLLEKLDISGELFTNAAIKALPRSLQVLRLHNAVLVNQSIIQESLGPAMKEWTIRS